MIRLRDATVDPDGRRSVYTTQLSSQLLARRGTIVDPTVKSNRWNNSDFRQRLRHRGRQWLNQQLRICIQTVRQFDRQLTVKSSKLNVFTSFDGRCNRLIQLSIL